MEKLFLLVEDARHDRKEVYKIEHSLPMLRMQMVVREEENVASLTLCAFELEKENV